MIMGRYVLDRRLLAQPIRAMMRLAARSVDKLAPKRSAELLFGILAWADLTANPGPPRSGWIGALFGDQNDR